MHEEHGNDLLQNMPQTSGRIGCGYLLVEDVVDFVSGEALAAEFEDLLFEHLDGCPACDLEVAGYFRAASRLRPDSQGTLDWPAFAKSVRDRVVVELSREQGGRPIMESKSKSPEHRRKRNRRMKPGAYAELFAMQQIESEEEEKLLVAEWIYEYLKLAQGSAAFFDGGSMCLFVFREYLRRGGRPLANVMTNNFLILQEWLQHPLAGHFPVSSVGTVLDAQHMAFYGQGICETLKGDEYRPSVTFIGTSGFGWEDGKLHFGYHAPQEREVKAVLFKGPSDKKVILATPRKIGEVSGNLLDLLEIHPYPKCHWYLVTTVPNDEDRGRYERTLRDFTENVVNRLTAMGIQFHWIEVSRGADGKPVGRDRMAEDPTLALIEAEAMRGIGHLNSISRSSRQDREAR